MTSADLDRLVCPSCGAANRPGATIIEVDQDVALCNVCSMSGLVCGGVPSAFMPWTWTTLNPKSEEP